jgi:DNA-directed RNA polymerase subunit RPC12/RpoP
MAKCRKKRQKKKSEQWTFKEIIQDSDNRERYQQEYAGQVTEHQVAEVEKMLGCREEENGFATYICMHCGAQVRVPFSCKSRVCSSCGKVHAEEWAKQLSSRMFNVVHRHITFTVPDLLWPEFEREASWRRILFQAVNATLRSVMGLECGVVAVLHPYGKDLKANYHVHVLVSEGGLDERERWRDKTYIHYESLRKVWQYEVLGRLREVMPTKVKAKQLIDKLYRQYPKGFYVHAKPRVENGAGISRYIGRYIRHPAIADKRIMSYDGEKVRFYYKGQSGQQRVREMTVLAFIHGVVRHIPPRQFKMIRYYGLYAPRKASRVREMMEQIGKAIGRVVRRLSWRKRIQRDFHRDPLTCPRCGSQDMELYSLTFRCKGRLVTIGGWDWLFERGAIIDLESSTHPSPFSSLTMQLRLTL